MLKLSTHPPCCPREQDGQGLGAEAWACKGCPAGQQQLWSQSCRGAALPGGGDWAGLGAIWWLHCPLPPFLLGWATRSLAAGVGCGLSPLNLELSRTCFLLYKVGMLHGHGPQHSFSKPLLCTEPTGHWDGSGKALTPQLKAVGPLGLAPWSINHARITQDISRTQGLCT